jgi:arylamine N-acetyltransferase
MYYKKNLSLSGLPSLELFLDGIERYHFGGTCYSNNYYLNRLLAILGYDVRLCGADMSNPDVHMVSMVSVEGQQFLVDAGYAAPFLAPLPRDLAKNHVVTLGRDRYVLNPQDRNGCSRLELYRDGQLKHGYLATPTPKKLEDFEAVITDSFRKDATFMNALLLARFYSDRSVVIHNLDLIESRGARSRIRSLASRDELVRVIEECFNIPQAVATESVAELGQLKDAWM